MRWGTIGQVSTGQLRRGVRVTGFAVLAVLVLALSTPAAAAEGVPKYVPWDQTKSNRSVFEIQVLLDRARFSPGVIDGRWGKNTSNALEFLLRREGLGAASRSSRGPGVDENAYARVAALAGDPGRVVTSRVLTEQDVSGPFKTLPSGIYEQAKGDCMCYESLGEKLAEFFHTTPRVLEALNAGRSLDGLSAGDEITVPFVEKMESTGASDVRQDPPVARINVSDAKHYVQAVDAEGRLLYHFPSTLGSKLNPSPGGNYRVNAVAFDPTWHFQPDLLGEKGYDKDAIIPPGPNNPVGLVWMDLSKPHYGIHGTNKPETIGYAVSHGCVRLTNWDAVFLAHRIDPGVEVHFVDVD